MYKRLVIVAQKKPYQYESGGNTVNDFWFTMVTLMTEQVQLLTLMCHLVVIMK